MKETKASSTNIKAIVKTEDVNQFEGYFQAEFVNLFVWVVIKLLGHIDGFHLSDYSKKMSSRTKAEKYS